MALHPTVRFARRRPLDAAALIHVCVVLRGPGYGQCDRFFVLTKADVPSSMHRELHGAAGSERLAGPPETRHHSITATRSGISTHFEAEPAAVESTQLGRAVSMGAP